VRTGQRLVFCSAHLSSLSSVCEPDYDFSVLFTNACRRVPCAGGFLTNVDALVQLTRPEYSGAGTWADGDMLQVCNFGEGGPSAGGRGDGGMTLVEYRASLSIWAVLGSPIIISADLPNLKERHPDCLAMLLASAEVLAISQDALGQPGRLIHQGTNSTHSHVAATTPTIVEQIFVRELFGDNVAAVMFNRAEHMARLTLSWTLAGMNGSYRARDAWAKTDLGVVSDSFTAAVKPHAAMVIHFTREATV
jgi:hypothetical protein